jgi:hypothetical protein
LEPARRRRASLRVCVSEKYDFVKIEHIRQIVFANDSSVVVIRRALSFFEAANELDNRLCAADFIRVVRADLRRIDIYKNKGF